MLRELNIGILFIIVFSLNGCLLFDDDIKIYPKEYEELEEPVVCYADTELAILYPQNQNFEILPNSYFHKNPVFNIEYSVSNNSLVFIDNSGFWTFLSPGALNIYNLDNNSMSVFSDLLFYRIWLSPNGEFFIGSHGTHEMLEVSTGLILSDLENEYSVNITTFMANDIDTLIDSYSLNSLRWINDSFFEIGYYNYNGWDSTGMNYKYYIIELNNMQLFIDYIYLSDIQIYYNNDRSKAFNYNETTFTYFNFSEDDTISFNFDYDISFARYINHTEDVFIKIGYSSGTRAYFIFSSEYSEIIELSPNAFFIQDPDFSSSGDQFVMNGRVDEDQKGIFIGENDGDLKALFTRSKNMKLPSFLNGYED